MKRNNQTDYERWAKTAKTSPTWDERNRIIATFIKDGSSILDIGAGSMSIKTYAPPHCTYQPVDCVKSSTRTIIADFNAGIIPNLNKRYDIGICSGILEYIIDPERFLRIINIWAKEIILSYVPTDSQPDPEKRKINGWLNSLSIQDLYKLFENGDISYELIHIWQGQLIFKITKKTIQ